MKQLIKNYTFAKATNQVTFTDFTTVRLERILLITDVTNNTIIYQFNNSSLAGSVSTNVLTLTYNTNTGAFNNSDALQIMYDSAAGDPLYDLPEVTGNVASGTTDSGNPVKVGGVYNTSLPSPSNGQRVDMQLDSNGRLITASQLYNGSTLAAWSANNVDAIATSSTANKLTVLSEDYIYNGTTMDRLRSAPGVSGTTGTGLMASGAMGIYNTSAPTASNGDYYPLQLDASANLKVNVVSGGINTQYTELATTTSATGTLALGRYQTSLPTLTNGQMNEPMLDSSSRLFVNVSNATLAVTESGAWTVGSSSSTGSGVPATAFFIGLQSSGSILQGASAANNLSDGTTGNSSLSTAQLIYNGSNYDRVRSAAAVSGTTGTGLTGAGAMGIYNTSAPTASNGDYYPLQLDSSANLKVNIAAGSLSGSSSSVAINDGTNTANVVAADAGYNALATSATTKVLTFSTSSTGVQTLLANTDVRGYSKVTVVLTAAGTTLAWTGTWAPNSGGTYFNVSGWSQTSSPSAPDQALGTSTGVGYETAIHGPYFELAISAMTGGTTSGYVILSSSPFVPLAVNASVGSNASTGSGVPSTAFYVAGKNSGNLTGLALDSSGNVILTGGTIASGDATTYPVPSAVAAFSEVYNGTTWDRVRSSAAVSGSAGTGLLGTGAMGIYNTSAPTASNGDYYPLQLDSSANLKTVTENGALETGGNLATIAGAVSSSVLQDNIKNVGGSAVATAATGIMKIGLTDGTGNAISSSSAALNVNISSITNGAGNSLHVAPNGSTTSFNITSSSSSFQNALGGNYDGFMTISIHGTYAGVSFGITQSNDGGTTFYNAPVYDAAAMQWLAPGATITPGTNASKVYWISMLTGNFSVLVQASAYTSGTAIVTFGAETVGGFPGSFMNQIMDAAGNARGANVTASNQLSVIDGASSATGSAVPSTASYIGVSDSTNLRGAVQSSVASGTTGTGLLGAGAMGIYNTSAPTASNGDYYPLQLDSSANLKVNVVSGGTNTQYAELATTASATGTLALGRYQTSLPTLTNGQMNEPMLDSSSRLFVNVSNATLAVTESGAWTVATNADAGIGAGTAPSKALVSGAVYNSTEISPTTGQTFALQGDSKGRLRNVIMDGAGNTRAASVTASNELLVNVNNATLAATQSGAWTMGSSSATGSAVPANAFYTGVSDGTNLRGAVQSSVASGTTGTGLLGAGAMGIYNSSAPTAANGDYYPLQLDSSANLKVNVINASVAVTSASSLSTIPAGNQGVSSITSASSVVTQALLQSSGYAVITVHGTYGGVSFGITESDDSGTTKYNVPVYDSTAQQWLAPGATITPGTNASKTYWVALLPNFSTLYVTASAWTSGTANVRVDSSAFGALPSSSMSQLMDAAGNSRGANVNASNQLSVIDGASSATGSAVPASASYVGVSDGTNLRGAVQSSVASGTTGTGLLGAGAMGIYNSSAPTAANGDYYPLQLDSSANLYVTSGTGTGQNVPATSYYQGAQAITALPTAATATKQVGISADKFGRTIVIPYAIRDITAMSSTSTTTTSATVIAGVASTYLDISSIVISNSSATATLVTLSDGTKSYYFYVPAGDTRGASYTVPLPASSNATTPWTATVSPAVSTLYITTVYIQNK